MANDPRPSESLVSLSGQTCHVERHLAAGRHSEHVVIQADRRRATYQWQRQAAPLREGSAGIPGSRAQRDDVLGIDQLNLTLQM